VISRFSSTFLVYQIGWVYVNSCVIIKIEAGKNQNPTLDTLKKISKALKVSVDESIG